MKSIKVVGFHAMIAVIAGACGATAVVGAARIVSQAYPPPPQLSWLEDDENAALQWAHTLYATIVEANDPAGNDIPVYQFASLVRDDREWGLEVQRWSLRYVAELLTNAALDPSQRATLESSLLSALLTSPVPQVRWVAHEAIIDAGIGHRPGIAAALRIIEQDPEVRDWLDGA